MPPKPPPPTHFLCIPLVTQTSRPQLARSIAAFRSDVCNPSGFGIPEDAVRPVGTLHLTLGVFSFPRNEGLDKAVELLKSLRLREIWDGIGSRGVMPGAESEAGKGGQGEDMRITLRGLRSMQTPVSKASVLYAPPVDTTGRVQGFCEAVRGRFLEEGVMSEEKRALLLHATVVNTIYVKGERRGKGRRGEKVTVDATGVLDRYEDEVWMEDVKVEGVAIFERNLESRVQHPQIDRHIGRSEYPRGPAPTMTPPEKRRVPTPGGTTGSPSRPPRTSPLHAASTSSSRHQGTTNNTTSSSSNPMVLAPPPRAALSGTSSPSPDDRRNTSSSPQNNLAPSESSAISTVAAAAAAAATQVLRDKDQRIAELERELSLMESVFTRELDKLSRAESESSSAWQARCGALQARAESLEGEIRALRDRHFQQDEKEELRRRLEEARREAAQREEEVRELRGQVRGLKEWVSTSTRSDGAGVVTDDEIGLAMTRLGNELQNWVLVNLRRARIDISRADEATVAELARLVPMYEDVVQTSKVHLIQSLVSRLLVDLVFDAYFVGLSADQAKQLTQVETFLSSFASSPEPINQWRSHTLTILKRDAGQRLQEETSRTIDTILHKVNGIIFAISDTPASEPRDQGLRALVAGAIDLARLLVVQKAIFKVSMPEILPHQRTLFDAATMEDLGGEDDDGLDDREISCVAFPGIIKRGDESGGHLQYRNVIAKAKVLCSPE
ncbi:AKAP7 2'5' RNA ligase-like domain-containing protein [Echria macrotheca]|uniref:AKAP7 2'5' RNA ligase-like domain-containing protein n=1 Tax=Echria macrotheca TaxID=438768 RepID=A0AAJ0B1N1_9PEZI|nr:AKAP7 2'5' RNA ligase-like domain-containing protein [Echria macrotheca]